MKHGESELQGHFWSERARQWFFVGALLFAGIASVLLVAPFGFALLFAVAIAASTQPLFRAILESVGGRRTLAALATSFVLVLAVLLPLGIAALAAREELTEIVAQIGHWASHGGMEELERSVVDSLPEPFERAAGELVPVSMPDVTGLLPWLVGVISNVGLDLAVFWISLVGLYSNGPALLRIVLDITPVEPRHAARLMSTFREIAHNLVFGSMVTGVVQGVVAGVGFLLVGVPHVFLLGVAIAVSSLVPMVGTLVVWGPVALACLVAWGWKSALFVAGWNLLFTGTIDNILKPLFVRGQMNIHPVLIFLAMCGGVLWFGVPGLLVGPVVIAFFMALYGTYLEEYLGQRPDWLRRNDELAQTVIAHRTEVRADPSRPAPAPEPG